MSLGKVYEANEPGKISGRIVVGPSRRVLFIPALRWIPAREITRTNAAQIIKEARGKMRMRARPCEPHELNPFHKVTS